MEELKCLTQQGSLEDYYDTFDRLYNKLNLPESHVLSYFLEWLKPELQGLIRMIQPTTLYDAYCLALLQEKMNVLANNSEVCDACIEVEVACNSIDEKHVKVIDVEEKLDLIDDKESVIGSVSASEMPIIDALCTDISCISEVEVPYIDAKQMELSFSDDIVHCGMSWCDGLHVHHSSSAEVYEVIDAEAAIPCLKEILYDNEIEDDDKSHVTEAFKSDSCSVLEIETRDISKEIKKLGAGAAFQHLIQEFLLRKMVLLG